MKKFIKQNIIGFIIGVLITASISVTAATLYLGKDIGYDNTKSNLQSNNVQDAIDEIYEKVSSIILVKTSEDELKGQEVTISDGVHEDIVKTIPTGEGEVSIKIPINYLGTYTVTSTNTEGDTAEETVEAKYYFTTNEVELSLWDGVIWANGIFAEGFSEQYLGNIGRAHNAGVGAKRIGVVSIQNIVEGLSYVEIPKVGKFNAIQVTLEAHYNTLNQPVISGYTTEKPTTGSQPKFAQYLSGSQSGIKTYPINSGYNHIYFCMYGKLTQATGTVALYVTDLRLIKS